MLPLRRPGVRVAMMERERGFAPACFSPKTNFDASMLTASFPGSSTSFDKAAWRLEGDEEDRMI